MRRTIPWAMLLFFAGTVSCYSANPSGREVLEAIRNVRLDPGQLYRVHDANLYREELRIYLIEGTLAFLQPVQGKVTGAIFVGEGEVLMIPPDPVEKFSMARFTGAPVLDEKFSSALFRFTDDTYERLRESIANKESAEQIEDPELIEKWNPVVGNLHGVHEMRVLTDLLAQKPIPFFAARFSGDRVGTFDVHLDYRNDEQLVIGQTGVKDERRYNDIWCSFTVRSERNHPHPAGLDPLLPLHFRIEARVLPSRVLQGRAEADFRAVTGGERVLQLELSRFLKVSSVQMVAKGAAPVDVEFSQNELVEESEIRRRGNDQLTVILPAPTVAGKAFTLVFKYEGEVISDSGNSVLFVGARGSWYPNRGLRPALFDLTFYCPRRLTLVATGDRVEDKEDGDWRVSRWRSRVPIRVAGFNLGDYDKSEARAAGIQVEVYGNRNLEPALQRQQRTEALILDPQVLPRMGPGSRNRTSVTPVIPMATPSAPPADVTQRVARDAAQAIEFYTKSFGPLPFGRVAVSPIPGSFGQGWPGLVYISTLSYYLPFESSLMSVPRTTEIFYRTLLRSHELAHQWWGNVVIPASYRDEWLVESLSNYSALMFVESHKGGDQEMRLTLDQARQDLLQKVEDEPAERAGPPTLGYRLSSSHLPNGVDLVMYKKGTWIIHMLRQLMRDPKTGSDANFLGFLRSVRQTFEDKPLSTVQFRQLAEKFVIPAANLEGKSSLEWFFEEWAYSTGIPEVHVKTTTARLAGGKVQVKGSVTLEGVDESFSLPVPLYIQTAPAAGSQAARTPALLGIVSALGKETNFSFTTTVLPQKILADPQDTLLAVIK